MKNHINTSNIVNIHNGHIVNTISGASNEKLNNGIINSNSIDNNRNSYPNAKILSVDKLKLLGQLRAKSPEMTKRVVKCN